MILESFIPSFILVLVSEMGDKSQIAALLLGAKYKRAHAKVFLGIAAAISLMTFISVFLGYSLAYIIPEALLKLISSAAFIAFGLYMLFEKEERMRNFRKGKSPFAASFMLMTASEFGDKTQLAAIALSANANPFGVFLGFVSGILLLSAIAIFLGRNLANYIDEKKLKMASALIFVAFGTAILLGLF